MLLSNPLRGVSAGVMWLPLCSKPHAWLRPRLNAKDRKRAGRCPYSSFLVRDRSRPALGAGSAPGDRGSSESWCPYFGSWCEIAFGPVLGARSAPGDGGSSESWCPCSRWMAAGCRQGDQKCAHRVDATRERYWRFRGRAGCPLRPLERSRPGQAAEAPGRGPYIQRSAGPNI